MSGHELKPCPFCGGIAKVCEGPNHGWWGTICDDCGVWRDDRHGTQAEAIAAWNRRTPDPAQIRADALREAAALMEVAATNCRAAFTYPPRTKEERDYQTGALIHTYARNAILALIDTPLSPPAVDNSPAPDAGGNADPAVYLIRKYGGYYRPNCQGYTRFKEDAGRYTLAEAIQESHPNGPDGPRDGMTYIHEDDVGPFDAGGNGSVKSDWRSNSTKTEDGYNG